MSFISYEDDEVNVYHPFFESVANRVLSRNGLESDFEWVHHRRSPSSSLIPDFVLMEKGTNRWLLAFEIKRTPSSVYSTRNQIQAQGYVLENVGLYHPDRPKYFAISNLEQIILFAHRDGQPPRFCRLQNGIFYVGSFSTLNKEEFTEQLCNQMEIFIEIILQHEAPVYDLVWPQIIDEYVSYASLSIDAPALSGGQRSPNWGVIRTFFCQDIVYERLLIFFLRCLLIDYIRALLDKHEHNHRENVSPLVNDSLGRLPGRLARIFDQLRRVDFAQLFEEDAIDQYRNLENVDTKRTLHEYVSRLLESNIYHNALRRLDSDDLIDDMLASTHPNVDLATRGKIRTDPEVAKLLVNLTITEPAEKIIDPCCGDGILLEAAYYKLKSFGVPFKESLIRLAGFECDELLLKLCYLRLVLKEPALVDADLSLELHCENMFDQSLTENDVLLMNPPFMRYESMRVEVPDNLKTHYATAIRSIKGSDSIAITGQQNLFTYYVDYVLSSVKDECIIGIILDNKWYHNHYGKPLRKFLLENSKIIAIVEYPYHNLFEKRMIATSILVCQKSSEHPRDHKVKFVRIKNELANIKLDDVLQIQESEEIITSSLSSRLIEQNILRSEDGWKPYFGNTLVHNYIGELPLLDTMFGYSRRGSLQKEEGGMSPLGFPWSNRTYGKKTDGASLSPDENNHLHRLAQGIPEDFKGYAIKKSDIPQNYILTEEDVLQEPTIEMNWQRGRAEFRRRRKTSTIIDEERTFSTLSTTPEIRDFIDFFREYKGLRDMPDRTLWVSLREPVAGELIIPRKQRTGHRVFVNPFAFDPENRQVRVSSNFIYYSNFLGEEEEISKLVSVVAAFLVSSFGQLQFEMLGANREGCLSLEKHHLSKIRVINPNRLASETVAQIINAFQNLPFPIPTDRDPATIHEKRTLDQIFSEIITSENDWDSEELLSEVYNLLNEYIEARQP